MSEIVGGGALSVTGPGALTFTSVTLGKAGPTPSSGTVSISAGATLSGSIAEAGPGLGTFRIGPTGNVDVVPPNDLSIEASRSLPAGARRGCWARK
jgi:hypothetical protein